MKFHEFSGTQNLTEIYQDISLKFATCYYNGDKEEVLQTGPWIKCRDYLNEYVVAGKLGTKSPKIWGYAYDAGAYPVNFDETHILVKGPRITHLLNQISLLNDVERERGWQETVIKEIDGTPFYLVVSSGHWLHSTVSISMFTHILRMLYGYNMEEDDTLWTFCDRNKTGIGNAATYQRHIDDYIGFEKYLDALPKVFNDDTLPYEGMAEYVVTDDIHNYGGIVSFAKAYHFGSKSVASGGMYQKELNQFRQLMEA